MRSLSDLYSDACCTRGAVVSYQYPLRRERVSDLEPMGGAIMAFGAIW